MPNAVQDIIGDLDNRGLITQLAGVMSLKLISAKRAGRSMSDSILPLIACISVAWCHCWH